MTVINQTGNTLTGATGTGNFVGANTPTLITPALGAATGTSLAIGGGALNSTVEITNTSSGATTDVLRLTNNTASGINSGVSLVFQPNGQPSRGASIRSLQTTAGNYADLKFYTAASDVPALAMTITTAQVVSIGSSTTIGNSQLQVIGVATTGNETIASYVNSNVASAYKFVKSRSAVVGVQAIVQNADTLGTISWFADDGVTFQESVRMISTVTAAPSAGIVPANLVIQTMNTSGSLATAMTISNAQVLTLANALPVASGGTGVTSSTGSTNVVLSNSPTLVTPVLGVASATSINFGGGALSSYVPRTAWTPVFTFATPGDLSLSAITSNSFYQRIGDIVYLYLDYTFTPTFTTASGGAQITGLPIASVAGQGGIRFFLTNNSGVTYPTLTTVLSAAIGSSASLMTIIGFGSASSTALSTTNFTTGVAATFRGIGYYFVN